MKRLLFALLALAALDAEAQQRYLRQYGVATTVEFVLFNADGTIDVDEADGGTETSCEINGAGDATCADDFNDRGSHYDLDLTAAEMAGARIAVTVTPTGPVEVLMIDTFGHPDSALPWVGIPGPDSGTAQATDSDTTSIQLRAALAYGNDVVNNTVVCIVAGAGAGDCRLITDYDGTTDEATVDAAFTADPTTTSKYYLLNTRQAYVATNAAGRVQSNLQEIDDDTVASDNAELFFDNTGFTASQSVIGIVQAIASGGITAAAIDADVRAELAPADGAINCTVDTANFAGSTTTLACDLTDLLGGAVSNIATNDFTGKAILVTSGVQLGEVRYINTTTWDAGNSELQLTLSRALQATLADNVTVRIY